MAPAEKGMEAPGFELKDSFGETVSLESFRGKWLVLYFYPRDDTSGCTKEALDFSALREEFAGEGCGILGVSPDPPESHRRFIDKHQLTVTLLSDPEKSVLEAYGAWGRKKNYGREYMGVIRTTVLVDGAGVVREVWRKVQVRRKTKTCEILHAHRVLARLRELKGEG